MILHCRKCSYAKLLGFIAPGLTWLLMHLNGTIVSKTPELFKFFIGAIVHCTVGYKVVMWSDPNPELWFPCQGNLRLQEMMGVMCKERGAKLFATDERWAKVVPHSPPAAPQWHFWPSWGQHHIWKDFVFKHIFDLRFKTTTTTEPFFTEATCGRNHERLWENSGHLAHTADFFAVL